MKSLGVNIDHVATLEMPEVNFIQIHFMLQNL